MGVSMNIIGFYSVGHDGSLTYLKDGNLEFCIEGEKDSNIRESNLSEIKYIELMFGLSPDVFAMAYAHQQNSYLGTSMNDCSISESLKGYIFRTTHERAHIMCAYGLSPFTQGQPCYVLCWEGIIGRFYHIDQNLNIKEYPMIIDSPGERYKLPFFAISKKKDYAAAGKTMALAAFASKDNNTKNTWQPVVEELIRTDVLPMYKMKAYIEKSKKLIGNIEIESQTFKDFSYYHSEEIFNKFYSFAEKNLKEKIPLLIVGGCGLNCSWNTAWKNSNLFTDVFIPPCTNDGGQSIGMAIDAQYHYTGNAKINWSVYAGEEFIYNIDLPENYTESILDYLTITNFLLKGEVVAWVQGKYEIGPRALSHRSLFAAPFDKSMHIKLNTIKKRESYRPIAPVCTEEDMGKFFDWTGPSPYMLHFMKVKSPELKAVTHVDGTARVQTITREEDSRTYDLLKAFKRKTGFPVLCNTSLNFKGKGFINRLSDLIEYVESSKIKLFVINNKMYIKSH